MRYIKLPVPVEMVRWDGTNASEAVSFLGSDYIGITDDRRLKMFAGKDIVYAEVGDWLALDAVGGHYPIANAVHEATYVPEKPVHVTEVFGETNSGDGESYSILVDDAEMYSVHDGEPEDNTLCRNFSDCYNVLSIVSLLTQPGTTISYSKRKANDED